MSRRLVIREVDQDEVAVELIEGQPGRSATGQPFSFAWPLTSTHLDDLRWYLEEYLSAPFAVYEDKGRSVRRLLVEWGEALFAAVFGPGTAGHDAYVQACAGKVGLALISRSPAFLGLPWELLRPPGGAEPLALRFEAIDRVLRGGGGASMPDGPELRILMVIARPSGMGDVGHQIVARRVVECLVGLGGRVALTVLRPPTREAFDCVLQAAVGSGRPYHIVHFDGHGGFRPSSEGAGHAACLAFETQSGENDSVPADWFAECVGRGRVPIVVLNACRSGMAGKGTGEAAIAMRVLEAGAASVVAMSYAVYAVAAAEFATGFYEALFAGDSVSAAVGAGRRRMYRHPARPSPKGPTPLEDWIVPVHHVRRTVRLPGRRRNARSVRAETVDRSGVVPLHGSTSVRVLSPTGRFVGQDAAFHGLEAALSRHRVALIHGPTGIGKTELAKAFARWWQVTGGVSCPEDVFFHRLDPGTVGLGPEAVLDAIGITLFGSRFGIGANGTVERRDKVLAAVSERRMLLVLDNFESVHSLSNSIHGSPPDGRWREAMHALVTTLARSGSSTLIMTSRSQENWLGDVGRIASRGLTPIEAAEMADDILGAKPCSRARREEPEFAGLLEALGGHPLALRLLLPQLDHVSAADLLAGLKGRIDNLPSETGERSHDPWASLAASLDSALSWIGDGQAALPALALFEAVVDAQVLAAFSRRPGVPKQFAGLTSVDWSTLLGRLSDVGILTPLGGDLYDLHPAIPVCLTAAWRSRAGAGYRAERSAAEAALLDAFAVLGAWLSEQLAGGDPGAALELIDRQLRTMVGLLDHALSERRYGEALRLLQPLGDFWKVRGRRAEALLWMQRAREVGEPVDGDLPAVGVPGERQRLWYFAAGSEASLILEAGDLGPAEELYDAMRALLEPEAGNWRDRQLSSIYHQLGLLTQKQGRYPAAEGWYRESLAIKKALRDAPAMATTYHQLGRVNEARGDLEAAQSWYEKGLAIKERLDDKRGLAPVYHQLGIVSHRRKRYEEANHWCLKALGIRQHLGDRAGLASSYNMLGIVAYSSDDLGGAETWYRRSLEISVELSDREALSKVYHQLGMLAGRRTRWEEAESWYGRSLEVKRELEDRAGEAVTHHQLGNLWKARGILAEAVSSYGRSLQIRQSIGDLRGAAESKAMLDDVLAQLGKTDVAGEYAPRGSLTRKDRDAEQGAAMFSASGPPGIGEPARQDPVVCRFRAEMPVEAALECSVRLEVLVSRDALPNRPIGPTAREGQALVVRTKPIILQALARLNCTIVGEERTEIAVPEPGTPTRLVFEVTGLSPGVGEVWVEARQGAVTLASLRLKPVFTVAVAKVVKSRAATVFACPRASDADYLVLRIYEEERRSGEFRLHFNLDCRSPSINRSARTEEFLFSREKFVASRYASIEQTWISCVADRGRFLGRMQANGTEMYDALVPHDVRLDLWRHRHRIKAIQVISEEPFIPWEIAYLTDPGGRRDGGDFLGNLGLVRWLHNVPWPSDRITIRPGRVRFVIPDYPHPKLHLSGAMDEAKALMAEFPGARPVDARSDAVERFLRRTGDSTDVIHFACHAEASVDEIWNAHLLMTGRMEEETYVRDPLVEAQIYAAARLGDGANRPLVFLNACQVGRTGRSLSCTGGFAKAFLAPKSRRGAGVFIGTLWSVGDTGASRFAAAFYGSLNSGKTLADAVRHARKQARRANDSSWLSYTVYGHPDARVTPDVEPARE